MFESAWDVEELYENDETLGQLHVPDFNDRDISNQLEMRREKRERQEYCFYMEEQMCKSILKKILFSCNGNVLADTKLDRDEKEFLISYDFARGEFRKPA